MPAADDPSPSPPRKRTVLRLKRIAGQVDALVRMVEEERYCIDVLTQVAAVQGALAKVGQEVLERHFRTCVTEAMTSGEADEQQRVVDELVTLLSKSSNLLRR